MKLRFRADSKDVIIFCIFAFFWLLVVALAVANVSAFLSEEPFTLNLFLAFKLKNIAATLIFFLAGIIAAFAGVKSMFLEKEDEQTGIGLTIVKRRKKTILDGLKIKKFKTILE